MSRLAERLPVPEEVAKKLVIYGKHRDQCFWSNGKYRFEHFAVRYRMSSHTNWILFEKASDLRHLRDYLTAMQASEPEGVDEWLAVLEVKISDMLGPRAI